MPAEAEWTQIGGSSNAEACRKKLSLQRCDTF
jgi:hypothetical protein